MAKAMRGAWVLALAAATTAGGCSWFGGGDAEQPIAPQTAPDVYKSPLSADAGRTGDYRRAGLLGARAAATGPTTRASGETTRGTAGDARPEYLVLGSVVANVNGAPIYAHELLQQTAPLLRARAKDLEAGPFKQLALQELKRQRQALIEDELVFAAAQRNTTPEEAREAQARTFMIREQMISRAGGSLEQARQRAREQGVDFDTMLEKRERAELAGIYFRKRIYPRASVTVDEMRRYYEQNRERLFTTPTTATIRVVRVDVTEVGSESLAEQRIQEARQRIASGENFDSISDDYNKQGVLRSGKGLVGPLQKGSYAVEALDDAIWKTPAGQPTPVVKSGGAYYVALVQEKKEGRTQAFDEPEVLSAIQGALREQKMLELRRRANAELQRDAVIQADDAMLQPAVEMAMQLYPRWHDGAAK